MANCEHAIAKTLVVSFSFVLADDMLVSIYAVLADADAALENSLIYTTDSGRYYHKKRQRGMPDSRIVNDLEYICLKNADIEKELQKASNKSKTENPEDQKTRKAKTRFPVFSSSPNRGANMERLPSILETFGKIQHLEEKVKELEREVALLKSKLTEYEIKHVNLKRQLNNMTNHVRQHIERDLL